MIEVTSPTSVRDPQALVRGRGATSLLRAALASDFRSAPWRRRFALIAVMAWLIYEWGPGNETFTPWILANVVSHGSGVIVIPIAAAVGFAFTTAQQLVAGFTALAGFSIFDRTSEAAWERLRGKSAVAPTEWSRLRLGARCALVFGLGTTAVALVQIMSTGRTGVRRHASVVVRSALLCGALVGTIAAVVATMAFVGRNVESWSSATEWTLRVLGNPLFWIGLLVFGAMLNLTTRQPGEDGATAP
jgi:hypothetical protein